MIAQLLAVLVLLSVSVNATPAEEITNSNHMLRSGGFPSHSKVIACICEI
jgi:hypothetical protein